MRPSTSTVFLLIAAALSSVAVPTPLLAVSVCPGDCDRDGHVVVSELVTAVNIALGLQPLSGCIESDSNQDGAVAVNELVQAVNAALGGCPPSDSDLTVANLNILHGVFCPSKPEACRLADRIDLLFQWIEQSGCPDVVTLQEIWELAVPLIESHLAGTCPFTYELVFLPLPPSPSALDQEMILTRYPVLHSEVQFLHPGFRHLLYARIDHPIGPVDVVTTHLASGSDNGDSPCGMNCPSECVAADAATVRDCQAVQLADFAEDRRNVAAPAVVTGDFNAEPYTFVYRQLAERGWLDVYLEAGNPECSPESGVGCTAGREDGNLSELESPESNEVERIDYIFVVPPDGGSCRILLDSPLDDDGDGTATRIFADDPNPFAPSCGPVPGAICWPSDHEGVLLDLNWE